MATARTERSVLWGICSNI